MNTHKLAALFLAVFAITLHAQSNPASIPYTCDFENSTERSNWTLENGSQTNKWAIGTAEKNAGSYGLYISNDNGATNNYTNTAATSYVYAYRSLNFSIAGNYTISFNWKSNGEGSYDNFRAFLVPNNVTTLTAGNANGNTGSTNNVPANWIAVSEVLNNQGSTWQSFSSASVAVTSTGTYKLVFFWKNDASGGSQPAAVDNISVTPPPPPPYGIGTSSLNNFGSLASPYTQPAAQTVTVTNVGTNLVTLTQPTSTNFNIGTLSETTLLATGATATFTVQPKANLPTGTYSETITISGSNGTSATVSANFEVVAVAHLPYSCDFENSTERDDWNLENGTQTNKWFIGTAAKNAGSYGLYISNDNGISNAITATTSYVYAYRNINFAEAGNYTINFNWKSYGNNYANLRAFLVPYSAALTAGDANGNSYTTNNVVPAGWIEVSEVFSSQTTWQISSNKVNVPSAGIYKLVFFWKNDTYSASPPAAVDNISVSATSHSIIASSLTHFGSLATSYTQPAAQTVTITNNGANAVTLAQPTSTNFTIGTLSTTSLATGATATFTVQPKANLPTGTYSETITVNGNNGASTTVIANFTVMAAAATLPYTCDFENSAERGNWTLENGSQTNKWFIGTAEKNAGSYGLYISNDNGISNAYTSLATSYVYAYRRLNFTVTGNHTISFNWKSSAGYSYNYANFRAFLVPDNVATIIAGDANGNTSATNNVPAGWIEVSGVLRGQSTWQSFSNKVNVPSTGTYKLVFFWKNYNSENSPPATVDNISVSQYSINASALTHFGFLATPYTQPAAQTVTITNDGATTITLTQPTSTNFTIGTLSTTSLAVGATATFTVRPKASLAAGTYGETIAISGTGGTVATVNANFVVTAAAATLPYTCDFENSAERGNWTLENGSQINKWFIGTAAEKNSGWYSLYISNNNGASNAYTSLSSSSNAESYVYAYRRISFTATGNHTVSFNWKKGGSSSNSNDNLRVFLVPDNVAILIAGNANGNTSSTNNVPTDWIAVSEVLSGQPTWQSFSNKVDVPSTGTYKLVFFWKNNAWSSYDTPAAVDNISVSRYSISATALTNFGNLATPYTQPAAQTITITNDGNAAVTLNQPATPTNFTITSISPTSLAVGATATFTVRPKAGLAAGTYSETITISGSNSASATASANFTVMAAGTKVYYITGTGTSFSASTASAGGAAINSGTGTIQAVIDAIRTDASGEATVIQFGDNSTGLDIGTTGITFNGSASWGAITLAGRITSTGNTIILSNGASIASTADITGNRAINNGSTGTVNINGGTVQATGSSGYAVYNSSTGTVNINGGTVQATAGSNPVYNTSTGTVNITGGEVKGYSGYAVRMWDGKITVSGSAKVTSANTGSYEQGTIYIAANSSTTAQLEITNNGTVENIAANGIAVYNESKGGILLSGDPTVTGTIMKAGTGTTSANGSFNPGSGKKYYLDFANFEGLAVAGGQSKASFFALANPTINGIAMSLTASGSDLVLSTAQGYAVSKSGTTYTITKGSGNIISIQKAIDNIRGQQTSGAAATIQFGNGTDVLDIGTDFITFDGSTSLSPAWGPITLARKITAANDKSSTIYLSNGASITSTADIAHTGDRGAIDNSSTGTVNINGGTVESSGRAIANGSTGTLNISGGTVRATGSYAAAISNSGAGAVNISGGTISAITGAAIYGGYYYNSYSTYGKITVSGAATKITSANPTVNNSAQMCIGTICSVGPIEITSGTVENTAANGTAIYNGSVGAVTISGGTISATTGRAIYYNYYSSSSEKITISGNAKVTSANTSAAEGTIFIANSGTATAERLLITGGTVENTANNTNARTIYNASTGAVTISGGTVQATGANGTTVYNNNTGTVIVNGGTVTTGASGTKYANNNSSGTIIAWDNPSGSKIYTAFASNDIAKLPETATARWLNKNNSGGIDYTNGANTGFAVVSGVTVSVIDPTVTTWPTAAAITYGEALTTSALTGGSATGTFAWTTPATIPTVTNSGYEVTFTPTDAANYNTLTHTVAITVNKAAGTFAASTALSATYAAELTLAGVAPPTNYAWITPTTAITSAGNEQTFPATYTDPSGNYEAATGNITVNVAKAAGTFGTPAELNTTYTTTLTLANVTPATGYAWNAPTTAITSAGNGQTFPATYTDPSGNYEAATGNITVNVAKATQAALTINSSATHTYGTPYTLTATGGTGEGTVTYAKTGGTGEGTISGNTLTITKAGTITLTATKAADDNYNSATSAVFTLTVNKTTQAALAISSLATHTFGTDYALAISGGNGTGLESFSITGGTGTGAISGHTLTISKAGTFTITATKAADDNYNSATSAAFTLTVNKANGLENDAPVHRQISTSNTDTHTYDLRILAFNKTDHGALSYTLGTFTDNSSILATAPTLSGTTLSYKGAGKTSGTATQVINITSDNYASITATITFVAIPKTEVAITGITEQNYTYDGNPKQGYTGTPSSGAYIGALFVEYAGEGHPQSTEKPINAGEYTVKISVPDSDPSYIGVWSRSFTIAKDQITKPAAPTALTYSGSEQTAAIAANAAYTITGNKGTNAGSYTATVALNGKPNREWTDGSDGDFELPWSIAKAKITKPAIASATLTYNGSEHTAEIAANAAYTITGNKGTNAGTYTATVALKDKPNREWTDGSDGDLPLQWTIARATYDLAGVSFPSQSLTYDGTPQSIYISGTLPAGVTVTYTGNGQTAINETGYAVTANFTGDANNYEPIPSMTATMRINKQTYNLSGIVFADKTAVYDGTAQSIFISGELPNGVTVSYEGNGQTAVGTYTVTANFAVANPATHNTPAPKTAELKIVEPNSSSSEDATPSSSSAGDITPSSSSVGATPSSSSVDATPSSSSAGDITPSSSSVGATPSSSSVDATPSSSSGTKTPIFTNRENPKIGRIGVQTTANSILLSNLPSNAKVEVYNLQGKRIYSSHSGNSQILKILVQTGVYILKINSQTLRIAVK
ncbi:hypothetical protein R83H12_00834 [Fibrobacteria bacterium R8-3-H12]